MYVVCGTSDLLVGHGKCLARLFIRFAELYYVMAFQPTTNRKDLPNRKILEELQQKKQMLLKSGVSVVPPPGTVPVLSAEQQLNKQCLVVAPAVTQSFAYYIQQDSNFGNQILPVIPRFEKN